MSEKREWFSPYPVGTLERLVLRCVACGESFVHWYDSGKDDEPMITMKLYGVPVENKWFCSHCYGGYQRVKGVLN